MPIPRRPKTFIFRGHRYQIVYKTMGHSGMALEAVTELRDRMYPGGVIKKTADERYAIGIRKAK